MAVASWVSETYPEKVIDGPALVREWYRLEQIHFPKYLRGELTMAEQQAARARDIEGWVNDEAPAPRVLDFSKYLRHYESSWRAFDDVDETIAWCKARNVSVAIASNGNAEQQLRKLGATGLGALSNYLLTPQDLGTQKPDPEFLVRACQYLNADPSQTAYVGDDLVHDVETAQMAGLIPIWIKRKNSCEAVPSDVFVLASLTELFALFDACL